MPWYTSIHISLLAALSRPQTVLLLGLLGLWLLAALVVAQLTTRPSCRHCGHSGRRAEFAGQLCPRCRRRYDNPPGSPIVGPVLIDDVVRVHLTTRLDNGEIVKNTRPREPQTLSVKRAPRALRDNLIGMRAGESRTVRLSVGLAYGGRRQDRILTLHYGGLRNMPLLVPGRQVHLQKLSREWVVGTVHGFKRAAVNVDTNHPLAGKELITEIVLLEILEPFPPII